MPSQVATNALVQCMSGTLDLDTDTIKVMLLKNTYTPDPDHKFVSSINTHECDATNYTSGFAGAGRKTLASKTVTENTTSNRAIFDAADPSTWTALGGATNNTLRYCAVIKEITNDAASLVIAVLDFGSDYATNGGDFTVQFSADGIFYTQH